MKLICDSPSAWCAACGPCVPGAGPEIEQIPVVVSPWEPAGPLSPPEGTPPARPGLLDVGDAHTLRSKLPHTTPVGKMDMFSLGTDWKRSLNLLNPRFRLIGWNKYGKISTEIQSVNITYFRCVLCMWVSSFLGTKKNSFHSEVCVFWNPSIINSLKPCLLAPSVQ